MDLASVSKCVKQVAKSLGKFISICYKQSFPQVILGSCQIYQFPKGWGWEVARHVTRACSGSVRHGCRAAGQQGT